MHTFRFTLGSKCTICSEQGSPGKNLVLIYEWYESFRDGSIEDTSPPIKVCKVAQMATDPSLGDSPIRMPAQAPPLLLKVGEDLSSSSAADPLRGVTLHGGYAKVSSPYKSFPVAKMGMS